MEEIARQRAVEKLISNFKANTMKEGRANITAGFLRTRIELLEKYWRDFQDTHARLCVLEGFDDQEYFTTDIYSTVEFHYSSAMGFLLDEQSRLAPEQSPPQQRRQEGPPSGVDLPRISIPEFSGRLAEWEPFRDNFRSMIHLHPTLTNVQKLHYLKAAVRGEASAAISSLAITNANYATAWQILQQRYNQRRLLAHHHMRDLARATALKTESATGLLSLLDRVTVARESLRSLELPVENWDHWMEFFLMEGLDPETRKDWEKEVGSQENFASYDELSKFITSRANVLQPSGQLNRLTVDFNSGQSSRLERRKAQIMATGATTIACPHCEKDHPLQRCPAMTAASPEERRRLARIHRACFNCLQGGHTQERCPSRYRCRHCKATHHTLLHASVKKRRVEREETGSAKRARKESPAELTASTTKTRRD